MDKVIIKNIFSLFSIQGMNYILPLITLPYLVRVLGPEYYGNLSFCLAFMQYFVLLTQYGFNFSVTRKISICRDNKNLVSKIFWNVICCKALLSILGLFVLSILLLIIPSFKYIWYILLISYFVVLGDVIFPIWLYQGVERVGWVAFSSILSKLLCIPLIFIFVNGPNDLIFAVFVTALISILSGLLGFIYAISSKIVCWIKPAKADIIDELKTGWHYFLSTAAISLYTITITVVLGFISGPLAVGFFVAADKLRQAVQGLINPVSQALYPRISNKMKVDKKSAFRFLRKLLKYQTIITLILSLFLFIFSDLIIKFIYGSEYTKSIIVLKILAWLPFVVGMSNVMGIQTLLTLGYKQLFSRILLFSGFINIIMLIPLVYFLQEIGAAISVLITESLIVVLMIIALRQLKVPLFFRG